MHKFTSDTEIHFTLENSGEHWELHFGDDSYYLIILFVTHATNFHFRS